jgi:hypothetical protein
MKRSGILRISEFDAAHIDHLWRMLCDAHASVLYIHFDLDVLSPKKFPATPVPVSAGISASRTLSILHEPKETFPVAGYGLFEYVPELDPNQMTLPFLRAKGISGSIQFLQNSSAEPANMRCPTAHADRSIRQSVRSSRYQIPHQISCFFEKLTQTLRAEAHEKNGQAGGSFAFFLSVPSLSAFLAS